MLVVVAEGTKRKMQSAINAEFEGSAMYASMPTRDVKNNVWLESSECKVVHTVRNVFKRLMAGLLVGNTATTSERSPASRTVCVACTDC